MRTEPTRGRLDQWVIKGGRCLNCCSRGTRTAAQLVSDLADAIQTEGPGLIAFVPTPRGPEVVAPRAPPTIRRLPVGRVGPGAFVLIGAVALEQLLAAIDTLTLVALLLATSDAILRTVDDCEDCVRDQLLGQDKFQKRVEVRYAKRGGSQT